MNWHPLGPAEVDVFPGLSRLEETHEAKRSIFETLHDSQSPDVLFITCADSRVEPLLFMQADPGTIFSLQNAGNVIPSCAAESVSTEAATIEYAMLALEVPHAIVCGHAKCGAVKAMLDLAPVRESLPTVAAALEPIAPRVLQELQQEEDRRRSAGEPEMTDDERWDFAVKANVLAQVDALKSHPSVRHRHDAGELKIHGWVYDFTRGTIDISEDV